MRSAKNSCTSVPWTPYASFGQALTNVYLLTSLKFSCAHRPFPSQPSRCKMRPCTRRPRPSHDVSYPRAANSSHGSHASSLPARQPSIPSPSLFPSLPVFLSVITIYI
jgi:hypothetical protein